MVARSLVWKARRTSDILLRARLTERRSALRACHKDSYARRLPCTSLRRFSESVRRVTSCTNQPAAASRSVMATEVESTILPSREWRGGRVIRVNLGKTFYRRAAARSRARICFYAARQG